MYLDLRTTPMFGLTNPGHWNASLVENPRWDFINQTKWFVWDPGIQYLPAGADNVYNATTINPTYWRVNGGRGQIAPSGNSGVRPIWRNVAYSLDSKVGIQEQTQIHMGAASLRWGHGDSATNNSNYFQWRAADGNQIGADKFPSGATSSRTMTLAANVGVGAGATWTLARGVCNIGSVEISYIRDPVPKVFYGLADGGVTTGTFNCSPNAGNNIGQHTIVLSITPSGTSVYWDGKLIGVEASSANQLPLSSLVRVGTSNLLTPKQKGAWRGRVSQLIWCAETAWTAEQVQMWHEDPYGFEYPMIPTGPRISLGFGGPFAKPCSVDARDRDLTLEAAARDATLDGDSRICALPTSSRISSIPARGRTTDVDSNDC